MTRLTICVFTVLSLAIFHNANAQQDYAGAGAGGGQLKTDLNSLKDHERDLQSELLWLEQNDSDADGIKQTRAEIASLKARIEAMTPRIEVFALKYANAANASALLQDIADERARVAVDERTNRLIVSAPRDALKVIEALVEQIDRPQDRKESLLRQFRVSPNLQKQLMTAMQQEKVLLSQFSNGILTVKSKSPQDMDRIAAIVKEIEANWKPESRTIRIIWLTDSAKEKNIPKSIEPIVEELDKIGASGMSVAAQAVVRTLGKFSLTCSLDDGLQMNAQGEYRPDRTSVDLSVNQEPDERLHGNQRMKIVSISTDIDAPKGHPVVLGVSPANGGNSAFVVIVD